MECLMLLLKKLRLEAVWHVSCCFLKNLDLRLLLLECFPLLLADSKFCGNVSCFPRDTSTRRFHDMLPVLRKTWETKKKQFSQLSSANVFGDMVSPFTVSEFALGHAYEQTTT